MIGTESSYTSAFDVGAPRSSSVPPKHKRIRIQSTYLLGRKKRPRQESIVLLSVSSAFSSDTNPNNKNNNIVDGLVSPETEFNRRQAIHETLQALQAKLPTLLTRPLTGECRSSLHTQHALDGGRRQWH
jgi:hypothetical protein